MTATLTEIMDLVDANAKAYYMGRGEDTRKQVQAAIAGAVVAEREACENLCSQYDHPGQIANAIRARGTP